MKLGRYPEALDDLEYAERTMNDNADLHAALAAAYEKLGRTSLAEEHRRRAAQKAGP